MDNDSDGVFMDKVALAMVDDLTVGDAVNFYDSRGAVSSHI